MTWVRQHQCTLPQLTGSEKLGDVWQCECGRSWAVGKHGALVFVPRWLLPIHKALFNVPKVAERDKAIEVQEIEAPEGPVIN